MKKPQTVEKILDDAKSVPGLEIVFDNDEITFYWENLRVDFQPDKYSIALGFIKGLSKLEARFE